MPLDRRRLRTPAVLTLAALLAALPRAARADEPLPSCTTTTTCTTSTTCTGGAAPLALQPPTVVVNPQPMLQAPPPPAWGAPQPPPPSLPPPEGPSDWGPPGACPPLSPQPLALPPFSPPGYRLVEKDQLNVGLAITGGAMLAATWLPMVALGYVTEEGRYAVPVAGPWFLAHDIHGGELSALLVLEGLAQATGAALFIAGLVTHRKVKVREPFTFVPQLSPSGAGLAAVGTF